MEKPNYRYISILILIIKLKIINCIKFEKFRFLIYFQFYVSRLGYKPRYLAIARERLYQDYIHDCEFLLIERLDLCQKLANKLIEDRIVWFFSYLNSEVAEYKQILEKAYLENI
jgi:hypothetical protein